MKRKFIVLTALTLALCLCIALAACTGGNDEPTQYTITMETDCAEAFDYGLTSGSSNEASVKVNEGSTLNINISIRDGYSAKDMVVKFNDTVLTVNFSSDNKNYTFGQDVEVRANGVVKITGIKLAEYSITMPAALPSGVSGITIEQILKKDATTPENYTDQKIRFGDSVLIKVAMETGKSLYGFGPDEIVELKSVDPVTSALNSLYSEEGDGFFNYYLNNIVYDHTLKLIKTEDSSIPSAVFNNHYGIDIGEVYYGFEIREYNPLTGISGEAIASESLLYNGEYNSTLNFTVDSRTESSVDVLDLSNLTFTLDGEPITLDAKTDTLHGGRRYYSMRVTQSSRLDFAGFAVNPTYLAADATRVVYKLDVSEIGNVDSINLRSKALYCDDDGLLVYIGGRNFSNFIGVDDIRPLDNTTMNAIKFYFGSSTDAYAATPLYTLQETEYNSTTYPLRSSDLNFLSGLQLSYMVYKEDGFWKFNYSIHNDDRQAGSTEISTDTVLTTTVADSADCLYIKVVNDTDFLYSTLTFEQATFDESGNTDTASALTGATYSLDETTGVLTITNTAKGYVATVSDVIKVGNDYKVLRSTPIALTFNKEIDSSSSSPFGAGFYDPDDPNQGSAAYANLSLTKDLWDRYVMSGTAYTAEGWITSPTIRMVFKTK